MKLNLDYRTKEKILLTLLLINAIINGGWFIQQQIAKRTFGVASLWFWIYVLPIAYLIAYYMGKLVAKYKGPLHNLVKVSFGDYFGFITAWIFILIAVVTTAYLLTVATKMINLPYANLIIVIIFIIFNILVSRGVKTSLKFSATIGVIAILMVVLALLLNIPEKLIIPPIPPLFILLAGVFFVFEAYMGWETVINLSGKVSDEAIQFSLKTATLLAGIFYILLALFHISRDRFISIGVLALILILGPIFDWLVSTPNFIADLSRKGYLYKLFKKENTNNVPIYSLALFSILVLLVYISGDIEHILEILVPASYFIYSLILLSAFRKFREWPALVGAFVLMFLFWYNLLYNHALQTFLIFFLSYILLGTSLYILFRLYKKKVVRVIHNIFAPVIAITDRYWKPIKDILELIPNNAKKIVEIGCGTGGLTLELAKRGYFVYATEISEIELELAKLRLGIHNLQDKVKFILEKKEGISIDDKVDVIVGVGVLGYIDNVRRFFEDLVKISKPGTKIIFVDYDYKRLPLISAPRWLREKHRAEKLFKEYGFDIYYWTKDKLLWRETWIYGEYKGNST